MLDGRARAEGDGNVPDAGWDPDHPAAGPDSAGACRRQYDRRHRESGQYADGWLPLQIVAHFDLDWFERKAALFRDELERERPGFQPRLLLRIGGDFGQLVKSMPGLAPRLEEVGVTDVVIDVDWSVEDGGRRALAMARDVGF